MEKDFKIHKSPFLLKNDFISVKQLEVSHHLFQGGWSKPLSRLCCERASAVVVIPYDPVLKKIVLVEQFRVGAVHSGNPWMIELVAGLIEAGESPMEVAVRELEEEAGLRAESIAEVMTFWASPGCSAEEFTLFCAKVDSTQAKEIGGLPEEGEDIKVHVFSLEEAFSGLEQGLFRSAPAVLGLQWLVLNQDRLPDLWAKCSDMH
jgi:ADP-ribose pyrophosphatase